MEPIPEEQLKVGMVVQAQKGSGVSGCWKYEGRYVPFVITKITGNYTFRKTADGNYNPDIGNGGCSCDDLNKLYLVTNNKKREKRTGGRKGN